MSMPQCQTSIETKCLHEVVKENCSIFRIPSNVNVIAHRLVVLAFGNTSLGKLRGRSMTGSGVEPGDD